MDAKEQKIASEIQKIVDKVAERDVDIDVVLTSRQVNILKQLNYFCTNRVLGDIEVGKDPRKIPYKANQELKLALVALCLSVVLTKHRAKKNYNKEYFEDNIFIESKDADVVSIRFENVEEYIVDYAINSELVFDWMVYREFDGRGIDALINEKVADFELDGYSVGGCPVYEFARFQRKYFDYKRRKQNKSKELAQDAFRTEIVKEVASQVAKQQLLNGEDPMKLVEMLFDKKNFDAEIDKMTKKLSSKNGDLLKLIDKRQ